MVGVDQYTIGWVCALLPELTAARIHLDEEHNNEEFEGFPGDDNTYVLGTIGKHNVVIAALPYGEYGTCSAATVAKDMIRSFPSLRVVLMVGIGGGVPLVEEEQTGSGLRYLRDIRLGDVVVSAPRHGTGGVIQPDLGKALPGGNFERTGYLNQPPRSLLTAVQLLTSDMELHGHTIDSDIAAKLEGKPGLKHYQRPDPMTDRLFRSSFVHPGANNQDCSLVCAQQPEQLIDRPARGFDVQIHYGLIASSNTLVRDAVLRDLLGKENNILCVEMEAAGLMNQLPVLVIRGICDYADSHKNKAWQGYASMTAAAYARMLLLKATSGRVGAAQKLSEIDGVREQLHGISGGIKQTNVIQQELLDLQKKQSKINLQGELTKWFFSPGRSIYQLPEDHRQDIVLGMQILVYSKTAISREELTDAIALSNYEDTSAVPDSLAAVCADVLAFTVEREFTFNTKVPYQVTYGGTKSTRFRMEMRTYSFKDSHLMNRGKLGGKCLEGRLDPDVANLAIAKACLTCLLQTSSPNLPSPFYSYSAKHWMTHYEAAVTPDVSLQKLALQLLAVQTLAFHEWLGKYDFPNWVSETTCCCPLFLVALNGILSLVDELLRRDDDYQHHSCAAVSAAISNGHIEVAKLLLDRKLRSSEQALQLASEGGHTEIIQLLNDNLPQGGTTLVATAMRSLEL